MASGVAAADIHVDPADGSDAQGTGSIANPFRSLTRALAAANAGDVIHARTGTFSPANGEILPLRLKDGVAILGAGSRRSFLVGSGETTGVLVDSALAQTTRFEGFSLRNCKFGIEVTAPGNTARFRDVRVEGGRRTVQLQALASGTVAPRFERCEFGFAADYAVFAVATAGSLRPVFQNCVAHSCSAGAFVVANGAGAVAAPVFSHCTFAHNGAFGLRGFARTGTVRPGVYNSILIGHTVDLDGVAAMTTGNNLLGFSALIGQRGNFTGAARLVDPTGGDLHVLAGGAGIGRGDPNLPEPAATDFEGDARGTTVDVGADEFRLHSLYLANLDGAKVGTIGRFRHLGQGGEALVVFLSYGRTSPGFGVPGITGRLLLDIAILLEPVHFGGVPTFPPVELAPVPLPDDISLNGVPIFLQSLAVRGGNSVTGGWSNLVEIRFVGR